MTRNKSRDPIKWRRTINFFYIGSQYKNFKGLTIPTEYKVFDLRLGSLN